MQAPFPPPVFSGVPSLWHLYDVRTWFAQHTERTPRRELLDIAKVAFAENLKIQKRRLAA